MYWSRGSKTRAAAVAAPRVGVGFVSGECVTVGAGRDQRLVFRPWVRVAWPKLETGWSGLKIIIIILEYFVLGKRLDSE